MNRKLLIFCSYSLISLMRKTYNCIFTRYYFQKFNFKDRKKAAFLRELCKNYLILMRVFYCRFIYFHLHSIPGNGVI